MQINQRARNLQTKSRARAVCTGRGSTAAAERRAEMRRGPMRLRGARIPLAPEGGWFSRPAIPRGALGLLVALRGVLIAAQKGPNP